MQYKKALINVGSPRGISWALDRTGIRETAALSPKTAREANTLIVAGLDHRVVKTLLRKEKIKLPKGLHEDAVIVKSISDGRTLATGRRPRALIYGILESARHSGTKPFDVVEGPSFHHRQYKHEPKGYQASNPFGRGPWQECSDDFWIGLFRQMSEKRLNGVWFWGDSSFENHLIWDTEYPEAQTIGKKQHLLNKKRFEFILSTAREYDVEVYVNLRLGHCPESLLRAHGLLQRNLLESGGEDSRVVRDYVKHYVSRVLEEYPGLAGFWLYFESLPDAYDLLRESVVEPMIAMDRPLKVFGRTWFLGFMDEMQKVARLTRGTKLRLFLPHKQHANRYCVPTPHPRIKEWVKNVPDAEVLMMTGPCHTTAGHGTIGWTLWADETYVQTIFRKAHDAGVRNISFNTIAEHFEKPWGDETFSPVERKFTHFVKPHLAMAARYMWKVDNEADPREWEAYLRKEYGLSRGGARALHNVLLHTSRIPCIVQRQFFGNRTDYEHPYLQPTASTYSDRAGEGTQYIDFAPPAITTVRETYLRVIDDVNGRKGHAPAETVRQLRKEAAASDRALARLLALERGLAMKKELKALVAVNSQSAAYHIASIQAQLALFGLPRAKGRRAFLNTLDKGLDALRAAREAGNRYVKALRVVFTDAAQRLPSAAANPSRPAAAAKVWKEVRRLVEKNKADFALFGKYLASLELYMRVNEHVRLYNHTYAIDSCYKKAHQLLRRSRKAVEGVEPKGRLAARFFAEWRAFLEAEEADIPLRDMTVSKATRGNPPCTARLRPDHVFFGETSLPEAMMRFFGKGRRKPEYEDEIDLGIARSASALRIRLEGSSELGEALYDRWELNRHVRNGTFFLIANFRTDPKGREVIQVRMDPFGVVRLFRVRLKESGGLYKAPILTKHRVKGQVKALGDGRWEAELTVPFVDLGAKPKRGEAWRCNVYSRPQLQSPKTHAWIYDGQPEGHVWNKSYGAVTLGHPYRMGNLVFA